MDIKINQRGNRDWQVTVNSKYAGVVTQFNEGGESYHTGVTYIHSRQNYDEARFSDLFAAVGDLVNRP